MTARTTCIFGALPGLPVALACVTSVYVLAGCAAGSQAYLEGHLLLAEGKSDSGLVKLEEAVRLEPKNAEYRIALASGRATVINRLIATGDMARREDRLADAEKAYGQVQLFDSQNSMARQGLDGVARDYRHRQLLAEAETLFKKNTPADHGDALEKIRMVLAENPAQRNALSLRARIDDARAKHARSEGRLAASFRKPVSLQFRDAPLKSVLEVLASVSGMNFFYDSDIRPDLKATVFAKNTSIEDALRLLLVTNNLEYKVLDENSILIYPNTAQKLKDYQTLSVRSFYLTNADVKSVANSIKTLVKTRDMVVDERLGIIIMRDKPEAIRMAERIVALQDLSDPEVMLEVEIMEIKRSRLLELGIQWPSQLTLIPPPGSLANLKSLSSSTVGAVLGNVTFNARKDNQEGNILANPRIRVRNREKAKVQIGDRVPVITTTTTSTGLVSESVSYLDVGLKLEVEPTIYLEDDVAIKINLEVSNIVREILSRSGTLSYQVGTRGANTVLRLKDGETQILAGLISDEDRSSSSRIPGFGDLPIAGRLFGSQKDDSQRSEILLSITPRVLRSIHRPDVSVAEFESGTESSVGSPSLRLNNAGSAPAAENVPTAASSPSATASAESNRKRAPGIASPSTTTTPVPATPGAGQAAP